MDNQLHIDPEHVRAEDIDHIRSCDYCRMRFADHIEAHELLAAPKNMQEAILIKSRQLDVQVVAGSNQLSKKLQLFYYSLKVSFATAFALGLLIWNPNLPEPPTLPTVSWESRIPATERIHDKVQTMLHDFSNQLFKTEVPPYDKQEK